MINKSNDAKKLNNNIARGAVRRICAVLILCLLTSLVNAVPAFTAEQDEYTELFLEDFENTEPGTGYGSAVSGSGISYIGSDSMVLVEGSSGSITGMRSLRLYSCDLRWRDLSVEELYFRIGFSVKVGADFDNTFIFDVSTQDPETAPDGLKGTLFTIGNESDANTFLYGADGTRLFNLKKDTVYRISAEMKRGSNECTVYINGEKQARTFKFQSEFFSITGLRLFMAPPKDVDETPATPESTLLTPPTTGPSLTGEPAFTELEPLTPEPSATAIPTEKPEKKPTNTTTLLIDDIYIGGKGRNYPQPYSVQVPGDMPAVKLDEVPRKQVRVFVNTVEIDMSKTYITENTVYISAEQFLKSISVDYLYDKNERNLHIYNDKIDFSVHVPGDEITVNGTSVKLKYPVRMIDEVIMISPNFINEVFNAKVWWDKDSQMLVITSGKQKDDNILRIVGDRLYMNGEPYYEISFNKYDLFYQLWAAHSGDRQFPSEEFRQSAAEAALSQLHDCGFRSIRVFCSSDVPELMYDTVERGYYFETMDKMFDLCDKYGIKVVVCLNLISDNFVVKQRVPGSGLVNTDETVLDLVADPKCESRTILQKYISEFVERYKNRDTVLMYEIVNEGNLHADVGHTVKEVCYSLIQLAEFYSFCAREIKKYDGNRIVSGGDSALRSAQWHLLGSTMEGKADDWTADTKEEHLYALSLLNEGVDLVSIHAYSLGSAQSDTYYTENEKKTYYSFKDARADASRLGKPLYNGEASIMLDADRADYADAVRSYLNKIVDAGVQLTHWWTFRSDRQGFNDGEGWRNDSGEVLEAIIAADRSLTEKYRVNGVGSENTDHIWNDTDYDVFDPAGVISGATASKETKVRDALTISLILAGAVLVLCVGVVFIFRRRISRSKN